MWSSRLLNFNNKQHGNRSSSNIWSNRLPNFGNKRQVNRSQANVWSSKLLSLSSLWRSDPTTLRVRQLRSPLLRKAQVCRLFFQKKKATQWVLKSAVKQMRRLPTRLFLKMPEQPQTSQTRPALCNPMLLSQLPKQPAPSRTLRVAR